MAVELKQEANEQVATKYQVQVVWRNVLLMGALHVGALLGLRECLAGEVKWQTIICCLVLYQMGGFGVTGGAHRLWSHRSYKATWPLRLILVLLQTMAFENSVYEWARDHRVHHKYSETDADPHNVKRGLFFAHLGWLLCRKHPEVIRRGKQLDLSDLEADELVMWQHRHYKPLVLLACFLLPSLLPHLAWQESLYRSFLVCGLLRYLCTLHTSWLVNSAAHMWGRRPYDKRISPSELKLVSLLAYGEGFHNFHHTFPFDYAASELGYELNITKLLIDLFASIGWATDRRQATPLMVSRRKARTGDVAELGPYGS